jgi:hypothetical protein
MHTRVHWIYFTLLLTIALLLTFASCGGRSPGFLETDNRNRITKSPSSSAIDPAPIVERFRALSNFQDSSIRLRAAIDSAEPAIELDSPKQVQFTMLRKRQPDGRLLMLIEFTAPAEERDRDGLITVFPDGQIEGIRYVQSTDSFIVTRDLLSEDALFGLNLQELADGQPEKYDFTNASEEMFEGTPIYRLEGKLKPGFESKFPRVVLLISRENYTAVQAEFYAKQDEMARNLIVSKTELIAGYWTRMRWTIDNRSRKKKISFEVLDVKYDQKLKDSIFTREHLKEISSR